MVSSSTQAAPLPGALLPALRLLSDPTRLRILALLECEELSVGELSRALGLSQSRVSNHLRLLREAGALRERHAGTSTFLSLAAGRARGRSERGDRSPGLWGRLWGTLRAELGALPEHGADRVRLERVLAGRREREGDFFDALAGSWDTVAGTFSRGQARPLLAMQMLAGDLTVADLGCGTGSMGVPLLGLVGSLICVDRSRGMLAAARKRLSAIAGETSLEFRQGSFDALPLDEGEVDAALCGLVLHHLEHLDAGLRECARILRPGGTLSVLELEPHRETWMHAAQGDRHLGLDSGDVLAALGRAGFEHLALVPTDDRYRPRRPENHAGEASLAMYIVRGRKPNRTNQTSNPTQRLP